MYTQEAYPRSYTSASKAYEAVIDVTWRYQMEAPHQV